MDPASERTPAGYRDHDEAVLHRLRERNRSLDPAGCTADGVCHVIPTG